LSKKYLSICDNATEVYMLLTENGVKISEEDAGKIYALLKKEKINDDELESVIGGEGDYDDNEEKKMMSKLSCKK